MAEDETEEINASELKRPAVTLQTYTQIKALADENMAISADDVGWEKCLEVVIDAYVPGHEDKRPSSIKDYQYE